MNATLVRETECVRVITANDRRRLESLLVTPFARRSELSSSLARTLARAIVVPAARVPQDVVTMNSIVFCSTHAGEDVERTLVYPWDTGGDASRVSVLTPLGLALLGNRVGARVRVGPARDPTTVWAISRLLYQPEEAGDRYR